MSAVHLMLYKPKLQNGKKLKEMLINYSQIIHALTITFASVSLAKCRPILSYICSHFILAFPMITKLYYVNKYQTRWCTLWLVMIVENLWDQLEAININASSIVCRITGWSKKVAHFSSTSIYIRVMPYKLQNVRYLYYWTIITFTVNYSGSLNVLNVATLLLCNISKTTTPFVNAAVNEALRQLVQPVSADWQ